VAWLAAKDRLAFDNFDNHIRINTLCPSSTDTAMMRASLERYPQLGKMIEALSPLKRAAQLKEVADLAVFLRSPAASYINGAIMSLVWALRCRHFGGVCKSCPAT
jgi:NAD(P)-dependent dehydrogenase (short-subunit alcohol dehydrogenase family)